MDKTTTFVLIHSPLVGPLTWQPVRSEMEQRGLEAVTPTLTDHPVSSRSFWQQHAESLMKSLVKLPTNRHLVLVAHSGAGPVLPAIRQPLAHSIRAYVFVDAGLPRHNLSRIDLMRLQDPQGAEEFYQALLQGERFPAWKEEDLEDIIPDDALRRKMVAEINPRSRAFFREPLPVFAGWPDAPCAYIRFSAPYKWDFDQARRAGWLVREMAAGHFHMLVNPVAVTDLILDSVEHLGEADGK